MGTPNRGSKLLIVLIGLAAFLVAAGANATPVIVAQTPPSAVSKPTSKPTDSTFVSTEKHDALAQEVKRLKAELASLQAVDDGNTDEQVSDRKLRLYGFFDVTMSRRFLADDSFFRINPADKLSFMVNRVNLYIDSQLTRSLRALVELGFSFYPQGRVNAFGLPLLQIEFDRDDPTYQNMFDGSQRTLGGVSLERVEISYQPNDWFGIKAGHFLTPMGIWNVDHGSPVIIPAREPFLSAVQMAPSAQTGVVLFGQLHFFSTHRLRYAFTVSNGRGPTEAVYDLDDNLALGLRLRWVYEGASAKAAIGGYGYWGKYTDYEIKIANPIDRTIVRDITTDYDELVAVFDALFEWGGIRAQSEFALRRVKYHEGSITADNSDRLDQAAFYGLLSYQLPLSRWLGEIRIRPYVMFEYGDRGEINLFNLLTGGATRLQPIEIFAFVGGLNIQPNSWLTFKLEGQYVKVLAEALGKPYLTAVVAQAAVSF